MRKTTQLTTSLLAIAFSLAAMTLQYANRPPRVIELPPQTGAITRPGVNLSLDALSQPLAVSSGTAMPHLIQAQEEKPAQKTYPAIGWSSSSSYDIVRLDFLFPAVGQYPAEIEKMEKRLDDTSRTCTEGSQTRVINGVTIMAGIPDAISECKKAKDLRLRIKRAEREFQLRMCR